MYRLAVRIIALAYVTFLTIELSSHPLVVDTLTIEPDNTLLLVLASAGHFLVMMVLGILATAARPTPSKVALTAMLLSYAVVMEWMHRFFPTRDFEWIDMGQNISGVLVGLALAELVAFVFRRAEMAK